MNKVKDNELGFSVIEALFILLIVGFIGFIGWYVYRSKNKPSPPRANSVSIPGLIYFTYNQNEGYPGVSKPLKSGVAAMKPDGTQAKLVYSATSPGGEQPFVDGLSISQKANTAIFVVSGCIYEMKLDGTNAHSILGCGKEVNTDFSPQFSSYGQTIYFYSEGRAQGEGIYKVPADGSSQPILVWQGRTYASQIRISPDGKHLAFINAAHTSETATVSILTLETLKIEKLNVDVFQINGILSWSPDGSSLLITVLPGTLNQTADQVIDASTGKLLRTLVQRNDAGLSPSGSWSQDGKYVVFSDIIQPPSGASEDAGQHPALFLKLSNGSGQEKQLTHTFSCNNPVWVNTSILPTGDNISL